MSTLSVCVIAKNEEKFLEESLNSISPVTDEIIFVDTGSDDKTVEIAKKFTNNIHYFKWIDDFSAAYNSATDRAKMDYIFRWDADFYLPKEYLNKLLKAKEEDFFGANLINFGWVDIDTSNNRPIGEVTRDLIYKKDEFYSYLPIHSYIKPKKGIEVTRHHINDLAIEHHKHHKKKAGRYDQSLKLIEKALQDGYDIPYLNFHYALALIYTQRYAEAEKVIDRFLNKWPNYTTNKVIVLLEKRLACLLALDKMELIDPVQMIEKYRSRFYENKQFILYEADVWAVVDPKKAVKYYQKYLSNPPKPSEIGGAYVFARYQDHPRNMLKHLC